MESGAIGTAVAAAVRVLITGAGGYLGGALLRRLSAEHMDVIGTTRQTLDLLSIGNLKRFGEVHCAYLCAGMSRFIDCESNPLAYRVNVDAQIELARYWQKVQVIFLSSEAVERALHTNYGMQKALTESGLRTVCQPVIARICGKVDSDSLPTVITWLQGLMAAAPGVYRCVI